jgi:hypothetical protein
MFSAGFFLDEYLRPVLLIGIIQYLRQLPG